VAAEALNSPPKNGEKQGTQGQKKYTFKSQLHTSMCFSVATWDGESLSWVRRRAWGAGGLRRMRTSRKSRERLTAPCSLSRPCPRERAYRGWCFSTQSDGGTILMSDLVRWACLHFSYAPVVRVHVATCLCGLNSDPSRRRPGSRWNSRWVRSHRQAILYFVRGQTALSGESLW